MADGSGLAVVPLDVHDVDISVVVPAYDECGSLPELYRRLTETLRALGRSYEILFIDDGSHDGSLQIMEDFAARDPHVGVIAFRRNAGKSAGLSAGFAAARGAYVITMDADLQDDPAEIPRLVDALEGGLDLVSGWKWPRRDPLTKTIPSKFFNFVTRRASGVRLHDMNCGLKGYRSEVVKTVHVYGELHRFIPVLAANDGFKVGEIKVTHHPRTHGRSKFGATRFINGYLDLIAVLFLTRAGASPLHLFGRIGSLCAVAGGGVSAYFVVYWLLGHGLRVRPLLIFGLVLIVLAVQFVSLGLLGEMMARPPRSASYTVWKRLGRAQR